MDLISAKHQKEIDGTQPVFQLEEDVHELLLVAAKPRKKFPVINKIDNYYADNVILFGELDSFKKELDLIANNDDCKQLNIKNLLIFIDKAIWGKNNLYVLAD